MNNIVIHLGKLLFIVDSAYLTEVDESKEYELLAVNNETKELEVAGRVTAGALKIAACIAPNCYVDEYMVEVAKTIDKIKDKIKKRIVLRLKNNSPEHISYAVGPVNDNDIDVLEGGVYIAYENDKLYIGETGRHLLSLIKLDIPATNTPINSRHDMLMLHDKYFEKAIETLVEMTLVEDNSCMADTIVSEFKDPVSKVKDLDDNKKEIFRECEYCKALGLTGEHVVHMWEDDGTRYKDTKELTGYSFYGSFRGRVNQK